MTQARKFEINKIQAEDKYIILIDDKPTKVGFTLMAIDNLNKYHPELDGVDEMILLIMQEIDLGYNLSEDEHNEYKQTLEHILRD